MTTQHVLAELGNAWPNVAIYILDLGQQMQHEGLESEPQSLINFSNVFLHIFHLAAHTALPHIGTQGGFISFHIYSEDIFLVSPSKHSKFDSK